MFSEQRGGARGGAEEQRSSSENTVQEESQLFSGPRIRVDLFEGRKSEGQEPNCRSGSSTPPPPAFTFTFSPAKAKAGGRGEGGGNQRKRKQPSGLGLEWKHDPTIRSWTTTFTEVKREKRDYRLQKETEKKKPSHQMVCDWEECAATDIHARRRRARKEDPQVWYVPTHPPLTGPSMKPFN